MKLFNLWGFKHFYDMRSVDCFFLSSASFCPHFILIFAINLQQWEKKIVWKKGFGNVALIKLFQKNVNCSKNCSEKENVIAIIFMVYSF